MKGGEKERGERGSMKGGEKERGEGTSMKGGRKRGGKGGYKCNHITKGTNITTNIFAQYN